MIIDVSEVTSSLLLIKAPLCFNEYQLMYHLKENKLPTLPFE